MKYSKYKKAGCLKCYNGQIISGSGGYCDVTYYKRCDCANIERKKYKKFLANRTKLMSTMTATDFAELANRWYDNNSHIKVGNNMVDRSW